LRDLPYARRVQGTSVLRQKSLNRCLELARTWACGASWSARGARGSPRSGWLAWRSAARPARPRAPAQSDRCRADRILQDIRRKTLAEPAGCRAGHAEPDSGRVDHLWDFSTSCKRISGDSRLISWRQSPGAPHRRGPRTFFKASGKTGTRPELPLANGLSLF
jgi:hypothetical protein